MLEIFTKYNYNRSYITHLSKIQRKDPQSLKGIKWFDRSFCRFLLVGVVNTLVGAGVMYALFNLFHVGYWLSTAANYLVGGTVSFFLNKYFTFRSRERSLSQVIYFALTVVCCYFIAYGAARPLVGAALAALPQGPRDNIAMLVGMVIYTVLNYFGQRFFAFKEGRSLSLVMKFPIIWLIVVIALELTVFNISSYRLVGDDYTEKTLDIKSAQVYNGERLENGGVLIPADTVVYIEWKELDQKIGTVQADLDIPNFADATVKINATDDTTSRYRYFVAEKKISPFDRRSSFVILRMSGEVHDMFLSVTLPEGTSGVLESVKINSPVPFRFSIVRSTILLFVGLFAWLFIAYRPMKLPCLENRRVLTLTVCGTTLICLLVALFMTVIYSTYYSNGLLSELRLTTGNQLTKELVDAFDHGQASLLTKPSKELLEMENPYDWYARDELGVEYLWDHCLYKGEYYSYYGIAPVLLLFLPYHLLTGYYFSSIIAVFIFGALGIIFLSLTYLEFIRRYFMKLPLRLALFGLLTLQMSSGIWFCFCAMNFYEIAQSSGFCFVTIGAYFLLTSNVIGGGRISCLKTAAAAICLSLAVLCRPTTALYCLVSLVFFAFGFCRLLKDYKAKKAICEVSNISYTEKDISDSQGTVIENMPLRKRNIALYLLSFIIPFALIGSVQMIYNYIRFDSFFDFGIQYSLTINDFTRSQFYARFVSIGIYNYLLNPPIIAPEFPYVSSSFNALNSGGYYFVANNYAVGLVWRAIPVLGLLLAPKALKLLPKKARLKPVLIFGTLSVLAPFAVLFSIWESGYGVRYSVDFCWEMLIGALAVLFYLYCKTNNDKVKELGCKAALFTLLPTALINFAMCYSFLKDTVSSNAARAIFAHLESVFNFWY